MTTLRIVWREMFERPSQLLTSLMAITLGIAVIVAIQTMTEFSGKAVARELDGLGANVLILPKAASVNNYYTADFQGEEMPEDYVDRITTSPLQGVDNLSPKLTVPATVGATKVYLTGILPQNELAGKPTWAAAGGVFARPTGCGTVQTPAAMAGSAAPASSPPPTAAGRRAPVKELGPREVLVGSEAAARLRLKAGRNVALRGKVFTVRQVLPETGSVDDTRVFAHLHTVQSLLGKGRVVNVIEMIGCCKEISRGLIVGLNKLLPDAKVVTIKQIAQTQLNTNTLMERFSLIFLIIIVIVGAAGIANYMFSNVQERRQEIGTLMALGMVPGRIVKVFLTKAFIVGLTGGVVGYAAGTALAVVLGPRLAQVPVLPLPIWLAWAVAISVAITVLASAIPAAKAARLDPAATLRDA